MGITNFSKGLIERALLHKPDIKSVVELGSQNDYTNSNDLLPPFANGLYASLGVTDYNCIDLAGDNEALVIDLSHPFEITKQFDLVTDYGTSEHCVQMDEYETASFHEGYIHSIYPKGEPRSIELGYYNCWLNKHNLCKIGGVIISENPKTGNWLEHGYSYLTQGFYTELVALTDYEIVELGENAAMGNTTDGWNIYCILEKKSEKFPSFDEFKNLSFYKQ